MTTSELAPLPFHRTVVEELQRLEPELWRWFSSAEASTQHEDEVRQELLKSTYRLDPAAHAEAYAAVERAKDALGLTAAVTLYQVQGATELNASVLPLADEAHIVFSGPALTLLTADELVAVLAHELAHFALWHLDERAYFVAERMLTAFANDSRAHVAHLAADRRFALTTEVFADRAGLVATGDIAVAVASLVKMTTGLAAVDAPSYLRQADEVFAKAPVAAQGLTHPEPFIRARALRLWGEQGAAADGETEALITGPLDLDALDLVQQVRVSELTRGLLEVFVAPRWLQSEELLAHVRLFFADAAPGASGRAEVAAGWRALLAGARPSLLDYIAYVLLDLATADPDLDDNALAAAFTWSDELDIVDAFDAVVARELELTKPQVTKRRAAAAELLERM
ncbi:MAG: SprT-like domain-containing protein [Gaiellaceae bacterium]